MQGERMMRLHELTPGQLEVWRQARLEVGQAKYGDAHMQRYGLVDIMEELLDALNILYLWTKRLEAENFVPECTGDDPVAFGESLEATSDYLDRLINLVFVLDKHLPDALCTDERGGQRIWWGEQAGGDEHD